MEKSKEDSGSASPLATAGHFEDISLSRETSRDSSFGQTGVDLAGSDTRSVIIHTESFAGDDRAAGANDCMEQAPPETVSCCSDGWPPFWIVIVLDALSGIICSLMFPDIATAHFNDGADPCAGDKKGTPRCNEVVSQVSALSAVFGMMSSVISCICQPLVGAASDVWGRRSFMILCSVLGKFGVFNLIGLQYFNVPIFAFFLFNELAAFVPPQVVNNLWVCDRTTPSERTKLFGRLMGANMIEGIAAPLVLGVVAKSPANGFIIVIISSAASLLVLIFGVRESLPQAKRARRHQAGAERCGLTNPLRSLFALCRHPLYRKILLLTLAGTANQEGVKAVYLLLMKEQFGMTMQTVAPVLSVATASNFIVMLWLIKPLEQLLGLKNLCIGAFLMGSVTCLQYYFATSSGWLLLAAATTGLGSAAAPAALALMSTLATSNEADGIGVSIGAFTSISTVAQIIGPVLFRSFMIFSMSPDSPFGRTTRSIWIFAILLNMVCIIILARIPRSHFIQDAQAAAS